MNHVHYFSFTIVLDSTYRTALQNLNPKLTCKPFAPRRRILVQVSQVGKLLHLPQREKESANGSKEREGRSSEFSPSKASTDTDRHLRPSGNAPTSRAVTKVLTNYYNNPVWGSLAFFLSLSLSELRGRPLHGFMLGSLFFSRTRTHAQKEKHKEM